MSLEIILSRIRADGEQQARQIIHQAEEDACLVLEQARQEAGQIYQAAYREALLPSEGECARRINEASFEASCLLGQARERFIEAALYALRERLNHIRETDGYAQVLGRGLREVLPPENGRRSLRERVSLEADPRDRALLEHLLAESGLDLEVRYTLTCMGGINACSEGLGERVVNTLDSRLERALPYLRRELAHRFEEVTGQQSEPLPEMAGEQPTGAGHAD